MYSFIFLTLETIKFTPNNTNTDYVPSPEKNLYIIALGELVEPEKKITKICKNLKTAFPSTQVMLVALNYLKCGASTQGFNPGSVIYIEYKFGQVTKSF